MKRKFAIFTIVRNEHIFLPIWYKYYSQYFNEQDIYVIDDSSDDGSTDFLKESQKHKIYNEYAYSHEYLRDNVVTFRNKLLLDYEYVIFAEADEILFHKYLQLGEYLNKIYVEQIPYVTATGYEIFHDPKIESNINLSESILSQRKYWFRYPAYDKMLVSNQSINYELGFHIPVGVNHRSYIDENFLLIHLHRFDYELHKQRKLIFASTHKHNDSPSSGFQNKLKTITDIDAFYFNIPSQKQLIPDSVLKTLSF